MEGYKKMPRSGIAHMQTEGVSTAPIKRSAPKSAAKAKGYKKGGAVKKAGGGMMSMLPIPKSREAEEIAEGESPAKPSAAARRKAMKLKPKVKPKLDVMIAIGKGKKEGGKVKKYADGGAIEDLVARRQASRGQAPAPQAPAAPAPQAPTQPPRAMFGDAARQVADQFQQGGGNPSRTADLWRQLRGEGGNQLPPPKYLGNGNYEGGDTSNPDLDFWANRGGGGGGDGGMDGWGSFEPWQGGALPPGYHGPGDGVSGPIRGGRGRGRGNQLGRLIGGVGKHLGTAIPEEPLTRESALAKVRKGITGQKDGGKVDCKKEGGVVKKKSSAMPVSRVEDTGFKSMTKMKSSMSGKSAATGHVQKLATGGRVQRLAEGGQYQYEKDPAESADAFNKRMATATMATDTYKMQNDPAQAAQAKAWMDEFRRVNNMPAGSKSDAVGDMQYWKKIVANQQAKLNDPNQGYRLPGDTNIRLPHAMEAGGTAPYITLAQAQEMAKTNPEIANLIKTQLPATNMFGKDRGVGPASTNLDLAKDIRQYAGGAGPSKDPWTFADQGQGADTGSAATPSGPSMEGFLKLINDRRATRNMPPLTSLSPTPDASQPPPATTQPPPATTQPPPATQTPPGTGQPPPNGGYGGYDWYGQNNGSFGGFSGGPIGFLDRPNKYVPNQARVSGGRLVQGANGQWVPQQAATAQTVPAQKKGGRVRSRAR
jgi:hypothetical protein